MSLRGTRRVRNIMLRPPAAVPPDPYGPGSPNYAERNRVGVIELPNGLLRFDLGEPCHGPAMRAKPTT